MTGLCFFVQKYTLGVALQSAIISSQSQIFMLTALPFYLQQQLSGHTYLGGIFSSFNFQMIQIFFVCVNSDLNLRQCFLAYYCTVLYIPTSQPIKDGNVTSYFPSNFGSLCFYENSHICTLLATIFVHS